MVDMKGKKNPNYKTGLCMDKQKPSLYNSWCGMKARCTNPKHPKYKRYGGRGISICEEWKDIVNFYNWAKTHGWEQGLTIDRINNDGNYCPENCRWVSRSENSRKKRTTKITNDVADEIRKRINENWYDLAKEYGCTHGNIWFIMNNYIHVGDGECTKAFKKRQANDYI